MDLRERAQTWTATTLGRGSKTRAGRRRVVWRCAGAVALAVVSTAGLALGLGSAAKAVQQATSTQTTTAQSGKAQPNLSDPTGPVGVPICGDQDGSEQPLVVQCSAYTRIPDLQMLVVPGSGPKTLTFDYVYKAGLIQGEMEYFKVDDAQGSIGTLKPRDAGYLSAVYQRAAVLFPQGANASTPDRTLTFDGGDRIVFMYVTSNLGDLRTYNPSNSASGSPYALFSLDTLNPDGIDHVLAFTDNSGSNQFSFEDLLNGGDRDYDDVVFDVRGLTATRLPLIVLPGITGSYLLFHFGEAWPRAGELFLSKSDTLLDNLQLAADGLGPLDPNDPDQDISVWYDHGIEGVIDELDVGCAFSYCPAKIQFYKPLFDYLKSHGYTEGVNLFPFAYDWRKSAGWNASILLAKIDQVLAQTGAPKVNILAHSQGGLVTEIALKDPSSVGKVSRVLTMGTPYLGAPKALAVLDYAKPCFNEAHGICILNPKEAQKLVTNFPGFLDLLPSRAYYGQAYQGPVVTLFDRNNDGQRDMYIDYATERAKLADRNLFLIDNSTVTHDLADQWLPADPSVQLTRIVGTDNATIEAIYEYQERECHSVLWYEKCETVEKSGFVLGNGDGTVPEHSADLYDASRGFDYTGGALDLYKGGVSHLDLTKNEDILGYAIGYFSGGQALAMKTFASSTRALAAVSSQPTPLVGTELLVKGPVYGLVTDSSGNRLGVPDATSGVEFQEIPGAVFNSASDSGSSFVTLDGSYQGSWTATIDGQVQLVARTYSNSTIDGVAAAPPIGVHAGAVLTLGFAKPTTLGSLTVSVDDDGNGTVDRTVPFGTSAQGTAANDKIAPVSQVTVQNFVDSAGRAMANVTITATDEPGGSGVGRIDYALVPSGTSGVYSSTLTVPATGKIIVRAIDRAGNIEVPYKIVPLHTAVAVAGGLRHNLAVMKDGTVWAWGDNLYGPLGDGTTTRSLVPVQVKNLSGVTAVAAGWDHSLGLKSDGTVWAWGRNGSGQLGNGTTTNSSLPVRVSNLSGVIAIAAGASHSLALKSDGTVWAWGNNGEGELGNGTKNSSVPVQVKNLAGVTAIAAGSSHSLARKSDGTVWAWGNNAAGELGNGGSKNSTVPVQVKNLTGATAVAGGASFSLALKSDGTVWSWGSNAYHTLGDGTLNWSSVPVRVGNLTAVTKISTCASALDSIALKTDGTVWAWGDNTFGNLGTGTTASTLVPVQSTITSATAVAATASSFAITSDGATWGWGYNHDGELGDGTTTNSLVPIEVAF